MISSSFLKVFSPDPLDGQRLCSAAGENSSFFSLRTPTLSQPSSQFKQILAYNHQAAKVSARGINPHLISNLRTARRHEMREHQSLDAGCLCNATGIFC